MVTYRRFLTLALFLALCGLATAGTYSSLVVYGDSLSDFGNLYAVAGQPGPPYYAPGRASNGPLAVEDLAAMLGTPIFNYAFGGATTGIGNHLDGGSPTNFCSVGLTGMTTLFDKSVADGIGALAPSALFMVWGGPDDFLSPAPADGGDPIQIANRAVDDLVGIVNGLVGIGAQHILVPGMPDLGLTPYLHDPAYSVLTDYFNARLLSKLPSGVMYFDTAGLMRQIVAHPAAYGFTDVAGFCTDAKTYVCPNPNDYLFYDDFHPSARGHQILADGFLTTVVPEPSTAVLVVAAAGLLAVVRRRIRV